MCTCYKVLVQRSANHVSLKNFWIKLNIFHSQLVSDPLYMLGLIITAFLIISPSFHSQIWEEFSRKPVRAKKKTSSKRHADKPETMTINTDDQYADSESKSNITSRVSQTETSGRLNFFLS